MTEARSRVASGYYGRLEKDGHTLRLPVALPQFQRRLRLLGQDNVGDLVNLFLEDRSKVLRPETFKAVRYGLGLFVSVYRHQAIGSLSVAEGRAYLKLLASLPAREKTKGPGKRLSGTTQARLWGVVRQFLSWAVIESYLARDPFESLPAPRIAHASYVVMEDAEVGLKRPGLVFHSTRKWFTTQCERAGVPEHFTASLVGHQSARSANRLTYGLYSAGISDRQKREIIDQIVLPGGIEL